MTGDRAAGRGATAIVAIVAGIAAYALYRATLLPGVDFGDSGSLQTTAGTALLRARDGYPLYFAIGDAISWLIRGDPAHAINLTSAIEGALAVALFVIVGAELAGSLPAAAAGAAVFAVSYTFWTQSVVAEVYALHLALVLASLWLLLRWERQPTTGRLAAFFCVYALAFGNHLAMILLAPAFTVFLLLSEPRGWRSLLAPRIVALAVGFALLGAAQYLWNLRTLWVTEAPPSLAAALRAFWFDVTKSDWRETMVLSVPASMLTDRAAMYWFDLRQQFGIAGIGIALAGVVAATASAGPRRALLLFLLYLVNVVFAFTYDVGDTHVFYLPSHLIVALFITVGIGALARVRYHAVWAAAGLLAVYACLRGYRDFPAVDRSGDTRPTQVLEALTRDLDDRRAVLLVDLNWQIANGLSYFTKVVRPEVAVARMRDVLLYAPALVRDNLAMGRSVVLDAGARRLADRQYGPLFAIDAEPVDSIEAQLGRVPRGTRYALCVLKPSRDYTLDPAELRSALSALTAGALTTLPHGDYVAVVGLAGQAPVVTEASDRPFTRRLDLGGVAVTIRMESWLADDTIRRMGFGHVIANRAHTLIVERGLSFTAFDGAGRPLKSVYAANIFAAPQRYRILHVGLADAMLR